MNRFAKNTIRVAVAIACYEIAGLIVLFFDPSLTDRLFPFLGIPIILGLVIFGIAFFIWYPAYVEEERGKEKREAVAGKSAASSRQRIWLTWILFASAIVFLLFRACAQVR